jgi:hypothetical protein
MGLYNHVSSSYLLQHILIALDAGERLHDNTKNKRQIQKD